MKTATFPSLRVDPDLRQAAEVVLQDGESLSSFVEQSIRESVERRQAQREFIARGLAVSRRCPPHRRVCRFRRRGRAPREDAGSGEGACEGPQVSYRVRFTKDAEADLVRPYGLILARDETDWAIAERALEAIRNAIRSLESSPFSYRKATSGNPFLRELVIPFSAAGYVALFEIDNDKTVTILAVRRQREDDYH